MFTVCALYHFTRFDDPDALRAPLLELCHARQVTGTLLLAGEGINGTIAGPCDGIDAVLAHLRALPGCDGLEWKLSTAQERPFARMKVRLKREIVTMGQPEISPARSTGTYVEPRDWNSLVDDPDVMVIDTRNAYETAIGTFDGAVDPQTDSFREFPEWAAQLAADPDRPKKLAMFCTGGIRCEKASALMQDMGFDEVYHLKGGILKYLEDVPQADSRWQGECFVFDGRVAVDHALQPGAYDMCHACRMPLSDADREHAAYDAGVSCHHCIDSRDDGSRSRFAERQKQITLARARGEEHLGQDPRKQAGGKPEV